MTLATTTFAASASVPRLDLPAPIPAPRPAGRPASFPAAAGRPLIEISGVSVFYGQFEAIKRVSLTIPENSVVAFIGPSGCGKSTFLRSINRLNDLIPGCRVTGELDIGGQNVYDPGDGPGHPPPGGRAGLPEAQPVPQEHLRQHRLRPAAPGRPRPGRRSTSSSRTASARPRSGTRRRTGCTPAPWACPAGSSSGCASPGRWRPGRRCC